MAFFKEADLPGIGKKFIMQFLSDDRMIVVVHDDGKREIYSYGINEDDEYSLVAEMTDLEARQVSGILGGIYYKPKALDDADISLHDMSIQWHVVAPNSPFCHKSINDLSIRKTHGVTVIGAIDKNGKQVINPGPEFVLEAGQTIIAVGEREQMRDFKKLLCGE